MLSMKVAHLASFNGNNGDNAHHAAFRREFQSAVEKPVQWSPIEIREFYRSWNLRAFDEKFVAEVNQYDCLVIGGGNFFEVCHDYSATGCTINLTSDVLDQIKIPILFNALGFDTHRGISEENLNKFKDFIDDLSRRDNCFITFRNDGSIDNFREAYGKVNPEILEIPDGGFLFSTKENNPWLPEESRPVIGINVACDRLDYRLQEKSFDDFCRELSDVFSAVVKSTGALLRFFPHIATDYQAINSVFNHFEDKTLKYHVQVMPYLTGQGTEDLLFSGYQSCDVVTGMRFHTNVCGIALDKPTCPIVSFIKLEHTYNNLGLQEQLVWADDPQFVENYQNRLLMMLDSGTSQRQRNTRTRVQKLYRQRMQEIEKWLSRF